MLALPTGCQTGPFAAAEGDRGGAAVAPGGGPLQLTERDVEAPEIFRTEESALWDGRPSLGGIWVAAPGVTDPERVVIRNVANGRSVVGALFKRERDNPGPALQLSSEAAAALGILAGSPTEVEVVALRREDVAGATGIGAAPPLVAEISTRSLARSPARAATRAPSRKPAIHPAVSSTDTARIARRPRPAHAADELPRMKADRP